LDGDKESSLPALGWKNREEMAMSAPQAVKALQSQFEIELKCLPLPWLFLDKTRYSLFITIGYAGERAIHCTFCKIICNAIFFQVSKTQFPHTDYF